MSRSGQESGVMKISPFYALLLIFFTCFYAQAPAFGIPITSSKGKTVEFAGVKSASPDGLEVQVKKGGATMVLPWSRLDLKKLETENPKIHEARTATLDGKKVALNLGVFAPEEGMITKPEGRMARLEAQGSYERALNGKASENFIKMRMALKVPGGKAKGIFVYLTGAANKFKDTDEKYVAVLNDTTPTAVAKRGEWFGFVETHSLAIVGLAIDGLKNGAKPQYNVAEGTGDGLLRLIDAMADAAKRPELKTAPLVMFGADVGGGAFAYNFAQWKPDRVAVVVAAKGAFYDAVPTEASAKVPIIFIQGEYDNDWELFGGKNIGNEVFEKNVGMKPNWTYALEPRGASGESLPVFMLSQAFLNTVIPMRMGEDGLKDIDRASSWVGAVDTKKVSKGGKSTEWTAGKTWLPDAKFAKSWEAFVNGKLEGAPPEQ